MDKANAVIVRKLDEVYVEVECEQSISAELSDFFSFYSKNYQFSPLYKKRIWDGKIYMYSKKTNKLYGGLVRYLTNFCKERGYKYEVDPSARNFNEFTLDEATKFAESLQLQSNCKSITPHDYQLNALLKTIRFRKVLLLSPTASGKSLMIYMIHRYLFSNGIKRGLLVVPTVSLVEQMYNDFKDYSSANGWDVDNHVQKIYQGQDKRITKNLTISTWQSIHEYPKSFFEQFEFIIGDEAHGYKADRLGAIMKKLTKASYRVGTTGTLDGETHKLVVEGHFGPTVKLTTTKELMDRGLVSELEISCIILKYPEEVCKAVKEMKFHEEMDFIVSHPKRNKFIARLANELDGNTLILFQYIDKHGKILYNMIQDLTKNQPNRKVFFVFGGTEVEDREAVRSITEKEDNAIIIASYGVFSTGINIKRLHNIIFASPSKSKIRNLQSIGRGLRLGEGKDKASLYDIADDLRIDDYVNYTLNHYAIRMKTYHEEKFKIHTYKVPIRND